VVNLEEAHLIGVDLQKVLKVENPNRVAKVEKRRQTVMPKAEELLVLESPQKAEAANVSI